MQTYLVGTGIVLFTNIQAQSPRQAIEVLKEQIRERAKVRKHPTIGMSLVNALRENRLNFIVFDSGRTEILAGEFEGEYQEPATRQLAQSLKALVPPALFYALPCNCGHC